MSAWIGASLTEEENSCHVEVKVMRQIMVSILAAFSLSSIPHAALAQSGFYVLGAIGNVGSDLDLGVRFGGLRFRLDSKDRGFNLGGGYRFNENISLEAAYQDFGTLTGPAGECPEASTCLFVLVSPKVDAAALSVSFVGSLRIRDRLSGYGRFGLTRWELNGANSPAFDESGTDLHYGVGLRWSFDSRWRMFAELTRVDFGLESVSAGVKYRF
jgi:opacity protein-like surface antigen